MAGGGRARAKLAQMKFKNRGGGRIIKQNPQKAKMNLAKGLTAGGGQKKRVLVTKGQSAQGKAVQKKRELQKKLSGQK